MYQVQRVLGSAGLCSFQGGVGKPGYNQEIVYASRSGKLPKGILEESNLNLKGPSSLL